MLKKTLAAAALAAVSAGAFAAAPNIVDNGSFDALSLQSGQYVQVASTDGWTATNGIEIRDGVAGNSENGANYVELDVAANTTISQTLATTAGDTYTLSFWYSDRAGNAAASNGMSFDVDGVNGNIIGGTNSTGDNAWHEYITTFTAATDSTVLSFSGTGKSDSLGESLDNVSVSVVPEPASLALMASGLALLGLSRRRSQSRR